jgi:hypothetical protein
MNRQQLVVLFGDSLLLDSVEASLSDRERLSVLRLRTAAPEVAGRLDALRPELIIFDVNGPNFASLVPFLRMQPSVPLLGLDINCQQAIGLTARTYSVVGAEELKQVIEDYVDQIPAPALLGPVPGCRHGGLQRPAG